MSRVGFHAGPNRPREHGEPDTPVVGFTPTRTTKLKATILPIALVALVALFTTTPSVGDSSQIAVESTVLFNTNCARCHEGECSGRMSFHLPREEADQHIRRHGGELPEVQVRELYDLLRYMKEECAFYPLPLALARDRAWNAETLGRLRSASGETYFLPLGTLGAGRHRVALQGLGPKARPCVELIDADFDFIDTVELEPSETGWELRFRIETEAEVFLRLKAPGSAPLNRVEIAADDQSP